MKNKKNKSGPLSLPDVIKETWWKYAALGFVEAEANYCIVKAYQYTSVTSVQERGCTINIHIRSSDSGETIGSWRSSKVQRVQKRYKIAGAVFSIRPQSLS